MDSFSFSAGCFLGAVALFIVALFAIPQWENLVIDTKHEACSLIDSQFVREDSRVKGGYCANGDTITYRFKD